MSLSKPTPARQLDNFERFSCALANVDCPPTVSFLATFPPAQSLPSSDPIQLAPHPVNKGSVELAITHLLRQYPLFRAGIADGRTRAPKFQVRDDVTAAEVLRVVPDEGKAETEILGEHVSSGRTFDGSRGPLWRVVLYEPIAGERGGEQAGPRLCLTISHVIADGRGMLNAFHRLLTLLHSDNQHALATLPDFVSAVPPTLEETVDLKLGVRATFRLAKDELVKPKLRAFLPARRPKLVPYPPPYKQQPVKTSILRLPPQYTAALKALAREHGLGTLHPLLQGAIIAAIVLASPATAKLKPGKKVKLTSVTAIDVRDPKLGHPELTGNYVTALQVDHPVALDADFFAFCRAYAIRLNSPAGRKAARDLMGAIKLIPDPKPKVVKPGTVDKQGNKLYPLTGYDKYMLDRRDGKERVESDVTVSNLTVMPVTGWEDEAGFGVCWAQTVCPFEPALTVSLLSSARGEMAITTNWNDGTMHEGKMAWKFAQDLEKVLIKLVGGAKEGVTIAELGRD